MTHHTIVLNPATANDMTYHIIGRSVYVYNTLVLKYAPTRLVVWDNTHRMNTRNGEPVRYTDFGPRDGGDGVYLDPQNKATDEPLSVLLSPESSAICADTRFNTGQPGSGQVFADNDETLADGDTASIIFDDMTVRQITIHFPRGHNGHGYATFTDAEVTAHA